MPEIIRLNEPLISQAGDLFARTIFHDPIFEVAFPEEDERAKLLPLHFSSQVRHGHLFGEVFTTTGIPAGISLWLPPGRIDVTVQRQRKSGLDRPRV